MLGLLLKLIGKFTKEAKEDKNLVRLEKLLGTNLRDISQAEPLARKLPHCSSPFRRSLSGMERFEETICLIDRSKRRILCLRF